jgi:hypothetical protein
MNAKHIIKAAKAKGFVFVRTNATLNNAPAYRLEEAQKHGYPAGPFGRSAAVFNKYGMARLIGYDA